jgi:hypothetical protein
VHRAGLEGAHPPERQESWGPSGVGLDSTLLLSYIMCFITLEFFWRNEHFITFYNVFKVIHFVIFGFLHS